MFRNHRADDSFLKDLPADVRQLFLWAKAGDLANLKNKFKFADFDHHDSHFDSIFEWAKDHQTIRDYFYQVALHEYQKPSKTEYIKKTDQRQMTILHWAIFFRQPEEHILALIKSGADVHAMSKSGLTALSLAAERGNSEVVTALLEQGANINASKGSISLSRAAQNGHAKVVSLLLANGADVNAANFDGDATALYFAVTSGHLAIVTALLAKNANVDYVQSDGLTLPEIAIKNKQREIALALIKKSLSDYIAKINLQLSNTHLSPETADILRLIAQLDTLSDADLKQICHTLAERNKERPLDNSAPAVTIIPSAAPNVKPATPSPSKTHSLSNSKRYAGIYPDTYAASAPQVPSSSNTFAELLNILGQPSISSPAPQASAAEVNNHEQNADLPPSYADAIATLQQQAVVLAQQQGVPPSLILDSTFTDTPNALHTITAESEWPVVPAHEPALGFYASHKTALLFAGLPLVPQHKPEVCSAMQPILLPPVAEEGLNGKQRSSGKR